MPRRKNETGEKSHIREKRAVSSSISADDELVDVVTNSKAGVKLKLKLGKETLGEKKLPKRVEIGTQGNRDIKAGKLTTHGPNLLNEEDSLVNVATSNLEEDDEEAWLDALEKGDLDDYGELKKVKDPNLMTARQRALKERTSVLSSKTFANVTLLGATKQIQAMTEEAIKRKEEKNKRRKLQAVKKAEESQKQTIERLIKQQGSKVVKERQKKSNAVGNSATPSQQKPDSKIVAMVKFVSKDQLLTISYPEGAECPMKAKTAPERPVRSSCGVCGGDKKYSCSRTGVPLCSLKCYKINIERKAASIVVDDG